MNSKDQKHIDELLAHYNVRRINRGEAGLLNLLNGRGFDMIVNSNSFTASDTPFGPGTLMYLGEDEADEEGSYFIALHEMGHVALGHHLVKDKSQAELVEQEIAAWEWALANAKYEPNDTTLLLMMDAVATYTDHLAWLEAPERVTEGVEAITFLQGIAKITETKESALAKWKAMDEHRREFTLSFYKLLKKIEADDPERLARLSKELEGRPFGATRP